VGGGIFLGAVADPALVAGEAAGLRRLARTTRLALSGTGASAELCAQLRVECLDGDLAAAAEEVARSA